MLSMLDVVTTSLRVHADPNTTLRLHLHRDLLPIQRKELAVLIVLVGDYRVRWPYADLISLFELDGLRNGVAGFDIALSLSEFFAKYHVCG